MTDEDEKAKECTISQGKTNELLKSIDSWYFDIFEFAKETKNEPLKCITQRLFNCYGIFQKFVIPPAIFNNFITAIETGYQKNNNPYHNNIHAADVTQTMNAILCETKLIEWLTDLEIFGFILAAVVHDFDHSGRTNGFHVATASEMAMVYNDRSVQENHHISASFLLLKEDKYNILKSLSRNDYHLIRGLVVDLILATDMAFHFQLLKEVNNQIMIPGLKVSKSRALALILHGADISNPIKKYPFNVKWANLVAQEFVAQGDLERELHMTISPLCDRYNTSIPKTQLNFMEFIVKPTFDTILEMVNFIFRDRGDIQLKDIQTPWYDCFAENRIKWHDQLIEEDPSAQFMERQSI